MTAHIPVLNKLQSELDKAKTRQKRPGTDWDVVWVPFGSGFTFQDHPIDDITTKTSLKDTLASWKEAFLHPARLERVPARDIFGYATVPSLVAEPAPVEDSWTDNYLRYWI